MRKILSVVALALMATILSVAQQSPLHHADIDALLVKLRSDEPVVRNDALQQLHSNPAALRDPKIKIALVNLLDQENHVKFSMDDEGYAEYVAWLEETTAKVVDWTDQRQVCILADGAYLEDELADHAKASLPCLLKRFNNAPHFFRGKVAAMMVQALVKGRNEIDLATVEAVQQATLSALHDPDEGVRIDTVEGLGKFGTEDMIPALKAVADTDPAPEVHGHSIRKWAAEAIAKIQKRAGQH
jgi:HEAT repeat protein